MAGQTRDMLKYIPHNLHGLDIMPVYVYNSLEMDNVYSVSEAADKLGLDTSQVRRLLAQGKIEGKKLGRDWVVLELSYKRRRKPKRKKQAN